jgi:hypothetical protein
MVALQDIYRYRVLTARCEAGGELDIEEIQFVGLAASEAPEEVGLSGFLRSHRLADRVNISEISPKGLVCRNAPWMEEGQKLEILLEDPDQLCSYRFKAEVIWTAEAGDDIDAGLAFVGAPVLLRHGPRGAHRPSGLAADMSALGDGGIASGLLDRFAA